MLSVYNSKKLETVAAFSKLPPCRVGRKKAGKDQAPRSPTTSQGPQGGHHQACGRSSPGLLRAPLRLSILVARKETQLACGKEKRIHQEGAQAGSSTKRKSWMAETGRAGVVAARPLVAGTLSVPACPCPTSAARLLHRVKGANRQLCAHMDMPPLTDWGTPGLDVSKLWCQNLSVGLSAMVGTASTG